MGAKFPCDAHHIFLPYPTSLPVDMKSGKNELWKLDLIECKFFKATPRLQSTKKLLNAKNNNKLMKKLPRTREEAFAQINEIKRELLKKKFHGSFVKLHREASKKMKADSRSWKKESHGSLIALYESPEKVNHMIEAKLVKCLISAVLTTKDLRASPPEWVYEELKDMVVKKSNPSNPSRFFIDHCQNDKVVNSYISKMWNMKDIKRLTQEIEWSFKKVRGELTVDEKKARAAVTGKKVGAQSDIESDSEESEDDGDSDSDSESGHSSFGSEDVNMEDNNEGEEIDAEEAFEKFAGFDGMVADSDDEDTFHPDPNVDYNEITDEEGTEGEDSENEDPFLDDPSDEEEINDEIEKKEKVEKRERKDKKEKKDKKDKKDKKEKLKLPALASGYFSGGSDDEEDVDNDKIVKEVTTTRKNRRGQRARQKIWEQKYGSKAKHVQKEKQRILSERQQKQLEFEERQRKREMKAKLAREAAQENSKPPEDQTKKPSAAAQKMHPSWEAKKLAEEKMKSVKFTGKKITFD
ncbi:hypothetical protein CA7LBN_003086 [Candidozyma auris]|uniref:Bud22 domain-containing protein n=2 Tax=Candidozyma auris TaxID=498019 RepID=A0A2H0ZWK8_CANAR|nr:hypothetical protein QG37_00431 [[Candida] auris]PIS55004.1 hypothetical protein B9J08_002154 [[Candida] auris]QWW24252.1 hypothetical protein CA7LBN_003086 [[Candida] auris]